LVEHAKEFTWNEDTLKEIYYENYDWPKRYNDATSYTWLMDDNTTLRTSFKTRGLKGNFGLSITISEEKDGYAMRPLFADLNR
jgi:hypothetical protein